MRTFLLRKLNRFRFAVYAAPSGSQFVHVGSTKEYLSVALREFPVRNENRFYVDFSDTCGSVVPRKYGARKPLVASFEIQDEEGGEAAEKKERVVFINSYVSGECPASRIGGNCLIEHSALGGLYVIEERCIVSFVKSIRGGFFLPKDTCFQEIPIRAHDRDCVCFITFSVFDQIKDDCFFNKSLVDFVATFGGGVWKVRTKKIRTKSNTKPKGGGEEQITLDRTFIPGVCVGFVFERTGNQFGTDLVLNRVG